MEQPAPHTTVDDYLEAARAAVPPDVWDYYEGGAGDEWTLAENRRAFDRWMLRPRFLRGGGWPDTSTTVLGSRSASRSSWRRGRTSAWRIPTGELATARGASGAGTDRRVVDDRVAISRRSPRRATGRNGGSSTSQSTEGSRRTMLERVVAAGLPRDLLDGGLPGQRAAPSRHAKRLRDADRLGASDYIYDPKLTWDDLPGSASMRRVCRSS